MSAPEIGAYKMSEAEFDAMNFTEVLALVGGDENAGEWVSIRRADAKAFTSDAAFMVNSGSGNDLIFSRVTITGKGGIMGRSFMTTGGGYGWMWNGLTTGRGSRHTAGSNLNTVWWWFGRHTPSTYNVNINSNGVTIVTVEVESRCHVRVRACTATDCGATAEASIGLRRPVCSVGSYLDESNNCQLCPKGTFASAGNLNSSCTTCPAGYTTEAQGLAECTIADCGSSIIV